MAYYMITDIHANVNWHRKMGMSCNLNGHTMIWLHISHLSYRYFC